MDETSSVHATNALYKGIKDFIVPELIILLLGAGLMVATLAKSMA